MNDEWLVYLVGNPRGYTYCGVTKDIRRRQFEHNEVIPGGAKYTKGKGPWKILWHTHKMSHSDACKLEYITKRQAKGNKIQFLMENTTMQELPRIIYNTTGRFFIPWQWDWTLETRKSFIRAYPQFFDQWFSHDWFNISGCGQELCEYLPHKFKKWWHPTKFDWDDCSMSLVVHCPDHIDTWFLADKINWEQIKKFEDDSEYGDKVKGMVRQWLVYKIMQ